MEGSQYPASQRYDPAARKLEREQRAKQAGIEDRANQDRDRDRKQRQQQERQRPKAAPGFGNRDSYDDTRNRRPVNRHDEHFQRQQQQEQQQQQQEEVRAASAEPAEAARPATPPPDLSNATPFEQFEYALHRFMRDDVSNPNVAASMASMSLGKKRGLRVPHLQVLDYFRDNVELVPDGQSLDAVPGKHVMHRSDVINALASAVTSSVYEDTDKFKATVLKLFLKLGTVFDEFVDDTVEARVNLVNAIAYSCIKQPHAVGVFPAVIHKMYEEEDELEDLISEEAILAWYSNFNPQTDDERRIDTEVPPCRTFPQYLPIRIITTLYCQL